jgi:hypothetical protein
MCGLNHPMPASRPPLPRVLDTPGKVEIMLSACTTPRSDTKRSHAATPRAPALILAMTALALALRRVD